MPPNRPWQPLQREEPEQGYVSIYYSDPLARYPVRHITKLGDNKSDPNIETQTYGLFSTCEESMRRSVVNNGRPWIFFIANLKGIGRALTGFYEIGWYAPGPSGARDIALAASQSRFIDPIPLTEISGGVGETVRRRFRLYMGVNAAEAETLRQLIESSPDRTGAYLSEVKRMESYSRSITGFTYPTWERDRSFGADEAKTYLTPRRGAAAEEAGNTSPTDLWHCVECKEVISNVSRLKLCPKCQKIGTLVPVQSGES